MRIELYNPGILKDTFETIGHIIDEAQLNFTENGLTIQALDKSHITFIQLNYDKTLFDSYECETPETIIIDTDQLMKILKRCKNDEILFLTTENNKLTLKFNGESSRQFQINLIDEEYESPKPPIIEYPITIKLPNQIIKDSLDDSTLFSKNLTLLIDQDYLHICSRDEMGNGSTHIRYLHGENIQEVVKSGYSIDKLKDIFRASKLSKTCTVNLGNDLPLTIRFEIPGENAYLEFLLAPRISEEY